MKILKKILSNRGQVSMEIGILAAAAVLVAVIAGFYYVTNVKTAATGAGSTANKTIGQIQNVAVNWTKNFTKI
ncbi:class III signal peptide-containing protein [Methanocaldococcus sp.]